MSIRRPRVAIIGTGGTVSTLARFPLDLFEYGDFGRIQDAHELAATVPELADEFDIVPVHFRTLSSTAVTPADWLELNELIHTLCMTDPELDGIVITHGTATLEETAYFLNLTAKVELPIVFVGAQRPSGGISSDAPINLLNAVRTAASSSSRGLGVLVVLNDEIHGAREVTKTSTYRVETFRAHDLGMLGYADVDRCIAIYRQPTRRHAPDTEFEVRGTSVLPRVDITYSYGGADRTAIDAFVAAGARGIVVASQAPGKTTPQEYTAQVEARKRGVYVFQSCRAGSGRVVERTLLAKHGIVAADNLNPQKARVLAMLAISRTDDAGEMQRMFREY